MDLDELRSLVLRHTDPGHPARAQLEALAEAATAAHEIAVELFNRQQSEIYADESTPNEVINSTSMLNLEFALEKLGVAE